MTALQTAAQLRNLAADYMASREPADPPVAEVEVERLRITEDGYVWAKTGEVLVRTITAVSAKRPQTINGGFKPEEAGVTPLLEAVTGKEKKVVRDADIKAGLAAWAASVRADAALCRDLSIAFMYFKL